MKIAQVWKAIVGFVAPGAVIFGSSVLGTSDGGSHITQSEVVTALVAMFVTAAGVYGVRNEPMAYEPRHAADE